jgi:hypothetical protein
MLERKVVDIIRSYLTGRGCYVQKNHGDGYTPPGIPDLYVFAPGGKFMAIEVKRPGGVVSPEQTKFIQKLNDLGFKAFVAYGLEEVLENE